MIKLTSVIVIDRQENYACFKAIRDIYPGAVDAEGFSRYGIEAAGFCGVNHDPKICHHTRLDTADNINPQCINLSLDICLEAAELYDKNGGIEYFRQGGREHFKRGYNK